MISIKQLDNISELTGYSYPSCEQQNSAIRVKIKLFPIWTLNYGSHFGAFPKLGFTMQEKIICETFSSLDNKYGIVGVIITITPRHIKRVKLSKRGGTHARDAEVNILPSSRLPGFCQPDVNVDSV